MMQFNSTNKENVTDELHREFIANAYFQILSLVGLFKTSNIQSSVS